MMAIVMVLSGNVVSGSGGGPFIDGYVVVEILPQDRGLKSKFLR